MTLILAVCLLSTAALADGESAATPVAQIGETEYTTWDAAYSAVTNDQTITLLADTALKVTNGKYALVNQDFTLDLNGYIFAATDRSLRVKIISTVTIRIQAAKRPVKWMASMSIAREVKRAK